MRLSLVALPIRSLPPNQRALSLVHSRKLGQQRQLGQPDAWALEESEDEVKSAARGIDPAELEVSEPHVASGRFSRGQSLASSSVESDSTKTGSSGINSTVTRRVETGSFSSPPSLASPRSGQRELEDSELVALARVGEVAAFEQLYRRHAPYALALAVRVQGHAGDVEDIVHDAFLRVQDRLAELRADASFRPWLSAIVVSLVRTRLRRRRMLSLLGLLPNEPVDLDALVHGDAGPEVRAQLAQVYSTLAELPVDLRICWTLRYIEGRKLDDVARVAGCSLATAKRRIAAVQERLTSSHGTSHDGPMSSSGTEASSS